MSPQNNTTKDVLVGSVHPYFSLMPKSSFCMFADPFTLHTGLMSDASLYVCKNGRLQTKILYDKNSLHLLAVFKFELSGYPEVLFAANIDTSLLASAYFDLKETGNNHYVMQFQFIDLKSGVVASIRSISIHPDVSLALFENASDQLTSLQQGKLMIYSYDNYSMDEIVNMGVWSTCGLEI